MYINSIYSDQDNIQMYYLKIQDDIEMVNQIRSNITNNELIGLIDNELLPTMQEHEDRFGSLIAPVNAPALGGGKKRKTRKTRKTRKNKHIGYFH